VTNELLPDGIGWILRGGNVPSPGSLTAERKMKPESEQIANRPQHSPKSQEPDIKTIRGLAFSIKGHLTTKWVCSPWKGPLDVDPDSESEPWLHHLFEYMQKEVGVNRREGHGLIFDSPDLKSVHVITPKDSLSSELTLVRYRDGLYVFISGKQETPADDQILPWIAAIDYATTKLATQHPSFDWWATIGPRTNGNQLCCLGGKVEVGPLKMKELEWACYEREPAGLLSQHMRLWLPVLVEGVSHGYSWASASMDAHRRLRRLCALLSLETEWYWRLYDDAQMGGSERLQCPTAAMGVIEPCTPEQEKELRSQKVSMDIRRMSAAWEHIESDSRVETAVHAFYEGMALREDHPSFALVAYASAIESVGKILFEEESPERCKVCGLTKFNPSRQLFRKALELVEPADRAQRMTKKVYGWRSGTAHSGRTYGFESTFGRRLYGNISLDERPEDDFYMRGVYSGHQAARSLLLKLFSGELRNA